MCEFAVRLYGTFVQYTELYKIIFIHFDKFDSDDSLKDWLLVNYKKNYDCIVYLISIISNIYRSGGGFLKETKSNLQSKVDDLYPAYDRNWIQVASYFTTVYRCTFVQCCRHNYFYQKYNFV